MRRFLDWLFDAPASYRVKYPDGKTTFRLRHSIAKSLQKMYGGTIIYDPPELKNRHGADAILSEAKKGGE